MSDDAGSAPDTTAVDACALDNSFNYFGLRVGAIFIILVSAVCDSFLFVRLSSRLIPYARSRL
jgi:hypothetical protein